MRPPIYRVNTIFGYFFGGLECVGPCFVYVSHFVFLRGAWIGTQRAAVATHLPQLSHPSSYLAIHPRFATHIIHAALCDLRGQHLSTILLSQ
jgi:hypothetical protein